MSASERESVRRRFVVDANVFVSAIKPFSRRNRKARTDTGSLALLVRLITDAELELFGSLWLFDEYKRLAEELNSEASELILGGSGVALRAVPSGTGSCRRLARCDVSSVGGSPDNQR
jgi:hypothetical protein